MNRSIVQIIFRSALPFTVASIATFSNALADNRVTPATSSSTAAPAQAPMKKASELLNKQAPPVINNQVMAAANEGNTHVIVSLSKQRAYLYSDDQIAIDTPVSTGKAGHETPSGKFNILAKEPAHHSNIYGNFVDSKGRIVRGGISLLIDSAPAGTHYEGAPMLWFMRLTDGGVGMHIGILPGYAASHGCVRLPAAIAPLIYGKVKIGTPVEIDP